MVERILEEHPNVDYHVWNFSRDASDRAYVKTITGLRTTAFNEFGAMDHNKAYKIYTGPEYQDCLFVKIDDDIIFLETARFGKFIEAIDAHRGSVVSANIINNGGCAPIEPGIWKGFKKLGVHLLDMHLGPAFAEMAHTYFFEHHTEVLNQPIKLVPTADWLSVNMIGYDWATMCRLVKTIGTPHPAIVADRPMKGWGGKEGVDRPYGSFGDEGVFQTFDRIIMKGFTAAHLSFGPQDPSQAQLTKWRRNYRQLGEDYLSSVPEDEDQELPDLSPVSHGQTLPYVSPQRKAVIAKRKVAVTNATGQWGKDDWRTRWVGKDNDPQVGRFRP